MNVAEPTAPVAALAAAYAGITAVVEDLDDLRLLLPTGCRGWLVADLLLHVTGDAQRALVAFATPTDDPPDVDATGYWRGSAGQDGDTAAAHAQWVRRSAAAFHRPSGVVGLWRDTAPAAARAAAAADPATRVRTQGHVLTVPEFVVTLVVEAAVHHLDLVKHLPDAPPPPAEALDLAAASMAALAAPAALPARWDPRETVLKGSGREPLTDADRQVLGAHVTAFPLLG